MAYDWRDALRRKLPHDVASGFPALPLLCRLLFLQLLEECDAEGRIRVGATAPADALSAMLGAHVGERRLLRQYVPALIEGGFLRHDGAFVCLRPVARTNNEPTTNPERVANEPATNSERVERTANEPNEPTTSVDVSTRNDTIEPPKVEEPASAGFGASPSPQVLSPHSPLSPTPTQIQITRAREESPESDPAIAEKLQRLAALEALEADRKAKEAKREAKAAKRETRKQAAATDDAIPLPGTLAHRVYAAIVGDQALRPIVGHPGDFAARITDPAAFPGVDVLAAVLDGAEYVARNPGKYTDGRAFLRNRLKDAAERERLRLKAGNPQASGVFPAPVFDRNGRPRAALPPSAREVIARQQASLLPPTKPEVPRVG